MTVNSDDKGKYYIHNFIGWYVSNHSNKESSMVDHNKDVCSFQYLRTKKKMSSIQKKYYYVFNQVISYWPTFRSEVSCIGPKAELLSKQLR